MFEPCSGKVAHTTLKLFHISTCRILLLVLGLGGFLIGIPVVIAQPSIIDGVNISDLREVLPQADSFSAKQGVPPVFTAYRNNSGDVGPSLIGYAFLTADLPPEEIGYSAPIEMLVGLNIEGTVTGLKILSYRESFKSIRGDFLATEGFPQQFSGKQISDGFRVGRDVDGVSRASISSWAVSRGIRNAARRVAEVYLRDNEFVTSQNAGASALDYLQGLSWEEMQNIGYMIPLTISLPDAGTLILSMAFMGNDRLGALLIGEEDYSRAEREASNRTEAGVLLLVGISGDATEPFRQERLALQQGEQFFEVPRRNFVYAGRATAGKFAGQVRFAGALVLDPAIDVSQPFTVLYYLNESDARSIEYRLPEAVLAQLQGRAYPAVSDTNPSVLNNFESDGNTFEQLINSSPASGIIAMILILSLAMTAFLRKSNGLRWLVLAATLLYLGFWSGGFLSVSHITNGIVLGPSMFMNDLPLLMLILFTLLTTLIWGRIFCSSLCPFGALQDFITRLLPRHFHYTVPAWIHDRALYIKYVILALLLLMALVASDLSIFQYFEPFGTLFFFSPSIVLWIILALTVFASTFIKRFYCRYACPLGAALGVMSLVSPLRIKRVVQCNMCRVCEHACPTGAIRGAAIDFKECVRCDICEIKLIARSGVCKHPVEEVAVRIKHWEPLSI